MNTMLQLKKIGDEIATLRRKRGLTGEKLAELLGVSAQAVSKWENGRCLPETAILPELAKVLGCTVDGLLSPKKLTVLEAIYTDGLTAIPVTEHVNNNIRDNALRLFISDKMFGISLTSGRIAVLTVKYQTPGGIFYAFTPQNEMLTLDLSSCGITNDTEFQIIGAYYGSSRKYTSAMSKMEHYRYFRWDSIRADHERFPSSADSDETEYLTVIYLNQSGICTVSCAEGETLAYGEGRKFLYVQDQSKCLLQGIPLLQWGAERDCCFAGAACTALQFMGESCSYEEVMGLSGACYRICFTEVWDWSCTDALVAFDYTSPLFRAVGYEAVWADRLEKKARRQERQAVMRDIQENKPVLAMNLRVAPEWGVITGFLEGGAKFLCRTYFDPPVFREWELGGGDPSLRRMTFEERGGYLVNDSWPFLLLHFGERREKPSPRESLIASLHLLVASFTAERNRGYSQGRDAYESWIQHLLEEREFTACPDRVSVERRLQVNDSMLLNLIDARRSAAIYLKQNAAALGAGREQLLLKMADRFSQIFESLSAFRTRAAERSGVLLEYNMTEAAGMDSPQLRREQAVLLRKAMELEEENVSTALSLIEDII